MESLLSMSEQETTFENTPQQPIANMKAIGLRFGLIAGVAVVAYTLIRYLISIDVYLHFGWSMASYIIIIGAMIMAPNTGRKLQSGYIKFKQALQASFLVAVISLSFLTVFSWVMSTYVDPNITKYTIAKSYEMNEKVLEWSGASEEQMEASMEQIEKQQEYSKGFNAFMMGLAGQWMVGFLYALVIAGVFHLAYGKQKQEISFE